MGTAQLHEHWQRPPDPNANIGELEREKGFEPSTLCLGSTLVRVISRISRLPLATLAESEVAVEWQ